MYELTSLNWAYESFPYGRHMIQDRAASTLQKKV